MDNAISRSAVTEIIKLHNQLGTLVRKSVQLVWELGQKLQAAKNTLDHGDFIPWLEENLGTLISRTTAFRYMSVFNRYPHGLPEDITLTQAYVDAGVKKLAAPEHEEEEYPKEASRRQIQEDVNLFLERILTTPIKGDVPLKNYRVAVNPEEILYVRKGLLAPLPAAKLMMTPLPQTKEIHQKYLDMLQIATEHYLSELEKLEEEGIVLPPIDMSPRAVMGRAGGVVPKEAGKFAPISKGKSAKRPKRPRQEGRVAP